MKNICSFDEMENIISEGNPLLIYFSGENCSVCKALKPKIEEQISQNFIKMELYEVKADIYKEIASKFSVFSIPTILVFFDSKEFFRKSRNISIAAFIEEIKRPYSLFVD
ncbi:thioredoxin family protein [Halarcobacter ebronensis]|uniref:Thiol reductase thioredoxin n=1 Tax=Halarcobacter ebronensis TaxID=1462615 RepID=A0A4V1M037_9BACT|nr:thioredoxin family protein [Halarcobacter ebronensis]QKF81161.1 thioredoxin [Halarcobacter ebronensis]RXK03264.1 thiol reductase thioredoxin [Halarcobacter ebronensis]